MGEREIQREQVCRKLFFVRCEESLVKDLDSAPSTDTPLRIISW